MGQDSIPHRFTDRALKAEVVEALQMQAKAVALLGGDGPDGQRPLGLAADHAGNHAELVEHARTFAIPADASAWHRSSETECTTLLQPTQHHRARGERDFSVGPSPTEPAARSTRDIRDAFAGVDQALQPREVIWPQLGATKYEQRAHDCERGTIRKVDSVVKTPCECAA